MDFCPWENKNVMFLTISRNMEHTEYTSYFSTYLCINAFATCRGQVYAHVSFLQARFLDA